jgi:two-component system OmpR family sensor kinase
MTRAGAPETELRRTARRIGLQTAGLLLACLVVVVAVLYGSVVRSQDEQMTSSLTAAVATAGARRDPDHDHDRDLSEPRGGIQFAVLDRTGVVHPSDAVPPGLPDLDVLRTVATTHVQDRRTVRLRTGGFEVLTVQRGDETVQVMASTFEQHQERERILGSLGLAGGAGVVLATLAAAILARRAVRPMARALEQQRRFVADAGHELRTPLTLLSTRSQLLARRVRDTTTPAEQRDQLVQRDAAGIVADTAALVAILEDLLTEADDRTPVPQVPVDLADVARSVVASASATAQQAGVTLRTEVDATAATTVHGAATALARAVAALVDNALDHATSAVGVRVSREGRSVVVEVSDDGPGIPSATLPRMFDRFSSDRRPTTEPGGRRHFGLGLALVSEIATRHGGTVTAENGGPPSTGALLRLTIPAVPTARPPHRPVPAPE